GAATTQVARRVLAARARAGAAPEPGELRAPAAEPWAADSAVTPATRAAVIRPIATPRATCIATAWATSSSPTAGAITGRATASLGRALRSPSNHSRALKAVRTRRM